jgi:DNA helicase-2/ATP-dependent DNA helicase PcrA
MNAVTTAVQAATREWSPYQAALFNWVDNGAGNVIVVAVAGSGKTTTGVEMCKRSRGTSIYLSFNKPIATELQARGVNGRTFHSLCYSPVLKARGLSSVESNKLSMLIRENFSDKQRRGYGQFITRLVGLARNAGLGAGLMDNTTDNWLDLANHHDLEPDADTGTTMAEGIELAQELLAVSNDSDMVDFDDLLYYAVKDGISLPKFEWVYLDEAQDTNAIQRAILRKLMKPHTRLVAVGDPCQAIYGFRGADSDSMDLLKAEFGCVEMPLTVTYRCAKAIVEFAQEWMPLIEAAPGAPDGAVTECGDEWGHAIFGDNDLVVCRTTRPLIALAYSLIKNRRRAHVMGREIGQGLRKLVEKMKAHGIDALLEKLAVFTTREVEKAVAADNQAKAEAIRDKSACVVCIAEGLDENDRTIPALIRAIDEIFSESTGGVTLATIHKSKGLEANRVFWLNSSKCPAAWARQEWQVDQEHNLCGVAATRAKTELVLIEEKE